MSNQPPFELRIFVADGDPDGLRLVTRSNWIGKAVLFPRALFTQVRNRDEFQQTGVYLLVGPRPEGDGEMLYIGEGDPVLDRLKGHYAGKDFWTRAVFFVAGTEHLNKAHVQYLESQLVARAHASKRMPLDNANIPTEPTLSEADRAYMNVFLDNMLGILPLLGIDAFEQSPVTISTTETPLLTCHGKGVTATGYDTPQGFVVKAGSYAAGEEAPSLKNYFPNLTRIRSDLVTRGVLVPESNKFRFAQDYTFNSPSQASSVVFANSSNGRIDWKDPSGRTLKELQEAQAKI
jgi:Domain of unknown function (DUF4357)